jgi:hypothetical protein
LYFKFTVYYEIIILGTYVQWNMDELAWAEVLDVINGTIPAIIDDR